MKKQQRATEFALRKRNHQEQQACRELEWQLKNVSRRRSIHDADGVLLFFSTPEKVACVVFVQTEKEISDMENDIFKLDADLKAKTAPLKLAHTRLENRTCRPGMDLCRDEVDVEPISKNKSLFD